MAGKLFAIVRVRGSVNVNERIERTMRMLHLHKKHRLFVVLGTPELMGMLNKVKDYCTFGEIDEATLVGLLQKRGRLAGNKPLTEEYLKKHKLTFATLAKKLMAGEIKLSDVQGVKPFFKLSPPRGGFEREGIKKPYTIGGVLGYRKAEINRIIRRMI